MLSVLIHELTIPVHGLVLVISCFFKSNKCNNKDIWQMWSHLLIFNVSSTGHKNAALARKTKRNQTFIKYLIYALFESGDFSKLWKKVFFFKMKPGSWISGGGDQDLTLEKKTRIQIRMLRKSDPTFEKQPGTQQVKFFLNFVLKIKSLYKNQSKWNRLSCKLRIRILQEHPDPKPCVKVFVCIIRPNSSIA